MARVLPDGWRELAVCAAADREIETLAVLAGGLSDHYTIYHAVHWTNLERGYAVFGSADFVIVNAAGDILLIEQKSGFLGETPDGLVRIQAGKVLDVAAQLAGTRAALLSKLRARANYREVALDTLLYCPDYQVRNPYTASLVPERIVDARRRGQLAAIVRDILPEGESSPAAREVHRVLHDVLQLDADVSALLGRARALITRVSGGLAYWARQLDIEPFRLRVTGTAGSGKTQLALAVYRDALAQGRRPLYVCFNRPLADHFNAIAPAGGTACTFHMLCERIVRAQGETPDFAHPDAFARLVRRAAELPLADDLRFDCLIVDEGQDFSAAWQDLVFRHAGADSKRLWLEDPWQNLYGRPALPLPGWVGLRAQANYRSPRAVVRMLLDLLPSAATVEAVSPFDGEDIDCLVYREPSELLRKVKEAIRRCYLAGFRKEDIVLLSYHGRENSQLMPLRQLGATTLRTFTGHYDLLGQPLYASGELLLETVYRFKGQAAPAVILAEIDFAMLDEPARRKLFVGATRAMMKLVLVVSERSAAQLPLRQTAHLPRPPSPTY